MIININNPPLHVVEISRQGENEFRAIEIDVSAWLAEYPDGKISVIYCRPDGELYPVIVNATESPITWRPTATDTAVSGVGAIEVRIQIGDVLGKSCTIEANVLGALGAPGGTPAAPAPDWAQTATEDADRAEAAAEKAEAASTHVPQISASKTWLVWDANKGEYVDTGVSAGKSAYQYAQDGGYTGTEAEFAAKLAAEIPTVDSTLTQPGQAADAAAVGDRLSALSEEIANLQTSGLTTAQINALDGMFKVAAYTEDVSGAYAAFKTAFGLVDTGVTTYTITAELVNVTSSNSTTSITEGASYSAILTAADGYKMDNVSILMGGVDVTADVYADGVISIPAVTGNVEIVASAVGAEATEELNTNGLVFNYDFRNSAMELYNLSGWGKVYRTVDKTGNSLIFGATEATGDEKGLKDYGFRDNRLVSSETEKVKLGETYTAQALFRRGDKRVQPSLFNWGSNVVGANAFKILPKYLVGTTETSTTVDRYSHEDTQYIVITYVVSGKSLTVYHNTDLVLTLDGNNYDNFTKWMDYGVPNSIYNTGYITAFVGYNRALTQSEIMDNIAFFKTLEVA